MAWHQETTAERSCYSHALIDGFPLTCGWPQNAGLDMLQSDLIGYFYVLRAWNLFLVGREIQGLGNWIHFVWILCSIFQRQAKYSENKLKCTKARNDYLLNLAATNAAVSKYYIHDVSDLIDVSTKLILFYSNVIHLSNENGCILDCGHAVIRS